jgi:type II secretory pathway pseudopilin PulG
MKTLLDSHGFSSQRLGSGRGGFALLEAIAVTVVFAGVVAVTAPIFNAAQRDVAMTEQVEHGRKLYAAMSGYAKDHDGHFPTYGKPEDLTTLLDTSNEAFNTLIPRYLPDKEPCFNKRSAWCKEELDRTNPAVLRSESDWCYVRGLRATSPAIWPLLGNAFGPGSTTYHEKEKIPGGVWGGRNAVVVWVGGNAEVVKTGAIPNGVFFTKRKDRPQANAFEKDQNWLLGEECQVLYPAK